jgi:hypothetical protein
MKKRQHKSAPVRWNNDFYIQMLKFGAALTTMLLDLLKLGEEIIKLIQ